MNSRLERKETFISIILEIANVIKIKENLRIIKDDPDGDIILKTDLVSNSDYIISGGPHLLNLKEFREIKILRVSEFLNS